MLVRLARSIETAVHASKVSLSTKSSSTTSLSPRSLRYADRLRDLAADLRNKVPRVVLPRRAVEISAPVSRFGVDMYVPGTPLLAFRKEAAAARGDNEPSQTEGRRASIVARFTEGRDTPT